MRLLTLLLILLMIDNSTIWSQSFYVSTSGDDARNGISPETAWRTIQKAANTVEAGSTVYIMEGVYNEPVTFTRSGNATAGFITFQNYNQEEVVIDGLEIPGNRGNIFHLRNVSHLRLQGLEIRNYYMQGQANGAAIFIEGHGRQIEIKNCLVYDINGSNGRAILVHGTHPKHAISGLVIEGNELFDCEAMPGQAVTLKGNISGFRIDENIVHDIHGGGLALLSGTGVCLKAKRDKIRSGSCSGNELYEVKENQANDLSAAIKVVGADSILLERNLVHHNNRGIAVQCPDKKMTSRENMIRNNLVYENARAGIILGSASMETVGCVENSRLLNNTCYYNNSSGSAEGECLVGMTLHCDIKNNLLIGNGTGHLLYSHSTETCNSTFDHNIYHQPGGGAAIFIYGKQYQSFYTYQNSTVQDANSLYANPQFLDVANHDFHLTENSPAVNAGDILIPETGNKDVHGETRTQQQAVDIGAVEFNPNGIIGYASGASGSLRIYPSIANSYLHVAVPASENETVDILIMEQSGNIRKVLSAYPISESKNQLSLDVSDLGAGLYVLSVMKKETKLERRFVVSR
jgi:hypothetical protein